MSIRLWETFAASALLEFAFLPKMSLSQMVVHPRAQESPCDWECQHSMTDWCLYCTLMRCCREINPHLPMLDLIRFAMGSGLAVVGLWLLMRLLNYSLVALYLERKMKNEEDA
jgi:hypothetical protein